MTAPLSELATARLVECAEAAAYADLARAAPAELGFAVDESPDGTALFAAQVDALLFNRVLALGLHGPARRSDVATHLARYRALGVQNFGVAWSPAAEPAGFEKELEALHLARRDAWVKACREAGPVAEASSAFRVEPAAAAHAGRFGEVACAGFGMPAGLAPLLAALVGRAGWHAYLAWDGATPVACGALFVREAVGWLGIAATLPAARRRGAQGALLARRLSDGARLGCTRFVTETGAERPGRPNPSLHNMLRAGFVIAYERPNFLARPGGPSGG